MLFLLMLLKQVQQAIYNNLKGRTVIIIAHRLSTVEHADRIIVLSSGTVAEQGTHQELLKHPSGVYAKLVQRQMLGCFEFAATDSVERPLSSSGLRRPVSEAFNQRRRASLDSSSLAVKISTGSLTDGGTPVVGSPKYGSFA